MQTVCAGFVPAGALHERRRLDKSWWRGADGADYLVVLVLQLDFPDGVGIIKLLFADASI
jgi:hypothetical protein